jgi:hypothetical protein
MGLALAVEQELIETLPAVVQRIREPAKVIAFKLGKTPRCVEGARQGEHLTSLPVAIALARLYPEFREYLTRLMDAETGESGEDPSFLMSEINRLAAKLAGVRGA